MRLSSRFIAAPVLATLAVLGSLTNGERLQVCAFGSLLPTKRATGQCCIGETVEELCMPRRFSFGLRASETSEEQEDLLTEIRSMRVKELKGELSSLSISTADAFEKEELVQRLYKARKIGATASSSTKKETSTASSTNNSNVVRGPLRFISVDQGRNVEAANDARIVLESSGTPYVSIPIDLNGKEALLLLDTACSTTLLMPSAVEKFGLPTFDAPVQMTSAGSVSSVKTKVTQIRFGYADNTYGPMPAVVQDIGGLPSCLDGMMGLDLLNQFACVDFDFRDGSLALYKSKPPYPDDLGVAAESDLSLTPIRVFTTEVTLDGRGPVKMIVDTGASNSYLTWKGVSDLGLSRDSPQITPMEGVPKAAMGADMFALEMTHSYVAKQFNLGGQTSFSGCNVPGDGVNLDIGDLPVTQQAGEEGVGGILGIDLMGKVSVIRMALKGSFSKITLLK